jgi:hypothetical protein
MGFLIYGSFNLRSLYCFWLRNKHCPDQLRAVLENIYPYGVFPLGFSDVTKQRQMLGWISALLGGKMNLKS